MLVNLTCSLRPKTDKPGSQPAHLHLNQDEHIEVKKGRLGYWRGHPSLSAEVGEKDDDVIIQQGEIGGITHEFEWCMGQGSTTGCLLQSAAIAISPGWD